MDSTVNAYIKKNFNPLLLQLTWKCSAWRALPLTPVGAGESAKDGVLTHPYIFSTCSLFPNHSLGEDSTVVSFVLFGLGEPLS